MTSFRHSCESIEALNHSFPVELPSHKDHEGATVLIEVEGVKNDTEDQNNCVDVPADALSCERIRQPYMCVYIYTVISLNQKPLSRRDSIG